MSEDGGTHSCRTFGSAADRADGRINPCDLYAFPAAPGTTAVILTVKPDAGRSSPTTFRPDALYQFVVASSDDTSEDIALRVAFTELDDHGQQQVQVRRADGPAARLARLSDPDGHAERVVAAFLPDVLTYRPGEPAAFHPGDGNGRALGDDAFGIAAAVLAGSTLANASVPRQATPAFPYLSAPQPADLPPLADYFRSPQAATR